MRLRGLVYSGFLVTATASGACGDDADPRSVDAGPEPDGSVGLPIATAERVFSTPPLDRNCLYASPLEVTSQGGEYIFLVGLEGAMTLVNPESGAVVWEGEVPREGTEFPYVLSTPAKVGSRFLLLAWQDLETVPAISRARHQARIFDLETRQWATEFAPVVFEGRYRHKTGPATSCSIAITNCFAPRSNT